MVRTFIVAPECRCIKHEWGLRASSIRDISEPQVAMDKHGPDASALRLQRAEQPRDDFVKEGYGQLPQLLTRSPRLLVELQHVPHSSGVEFLPGIGPSIVLRQSPVVRCGVEAELASRVCVCAESMELGHGVCELGDRWIAVAKGVEGEEDKVPIRVLAFAPSQRSRGEVRDKFVDHSHRFVLAFEHGASTGAVRELNGGNIVTIVQSKHEETGIGPAVAFGYLEEVRNLFPVDLSVNSGCCIPIACTVASTALDNGRRRECYMSYCHERRVQVWKYGGRGRTHLL